MQGGFSREVTEGCDSETVLLAILARLGRYQLSHPSPPPAPAAVTPPARPAPAPAAPAVRAC